MTWTCTQCGGPCDAPMPAEDLPGALVHRCPTCRKDWVQEPDPVDAAELRAAARRVVAERTTMCGPCLGRRHWACIRRDPCGCFRCRPEGGW